MSAMKHDEMIAVIQAHKEGRTIQVQNVNDVWVDLAQPDWDFFRSTYRIKPEPREFWIHDDGSSLTVIPIGTPARLHPATCENCIHVREVLE